VKNAYEVIQMSSVNSELKKKHVRFAIENVYGRWVKEAFRVFSSEDRTLD